MPNRLAGESSPYLQQHAHNPVDWYPWGPEALARARAEDKPILLSIGYSACHWCHVMERESFEDADVAVFMNRDFINIKIDREERPDLDHIYMNAVQVMTGSGGWPLNVFLTPDGRPFTGGTYFPPSDMPGRPAWTSVLRRVREAFREQRDKVEEQADMLLGHMREQEARFVAPLAGVSGATGSGADQRPGLNLAANLGEPLLFGPDFQSRVLDSHLKQADERNGGFGSAPKFPASMSLRFLLRHGHADRQKGLGASFPKATQHALHSLEAMGAGGIYDHLGGGFTRYATDSHWLVPHFEKMLYDNALLVAAYAEAYQVEKRPRFAQIISETLGFVLREWQDPRGGFYATLDADSEGVEGKFYVWQDQEIRSLLGGQADRFCRFYGVRPGGNWEGVNILHRSLSSERFAAQEGMTAEAWEAERKAGSALLLAARASRIRPGLDDKVILGWNALMATGLFKAAAALHGSDPDADCWRSAAEACLDFLLAELRPKAAAGPVSDPAAGPVPGTTPASQGLLRVWQQGRSRFEAVLDDYAFLIAALLDCYESAFDLGRLRQALHWTEWVMEQFSDPDGRYFYYTSLQTSDVIVRQVDLYDGATPSGNAIMAENLLRLALFSGRQAYRNRGLAMLQGIEETVARYGTSFGAWACAMADEGAGRREIAVVGPDYQVFSRELQRRFSPGAVFMAAEQAPQGQFLGEWPLLDGRGSDGETRIFVCRHYACEQPVTHPDEAGW
ncbi:MAG: DUF255 domain-containing protein [Bacteroidetes bacterium]|nr:DUF255 domain-containing protein [Bacteroidota bacterium]